MTNVFETADKLSMKHKLVTLAILALEKDGWAVTKATGGGSLYSIKKGSKNLLASIRTTQDCHIAFPRIENDTQWRTLADVDVVIPVSVDNKLNPKHALVHMVSGDEMRDRFDRTYAARKKAGYVIPVGRGVWLSLYDEENNSNPVHVGAGAGLEHPPIARFALNEASPVAPKETITALTKLTIAEAKILLAESLGVNPSNITITVAA